MYISNVSCFSYDCLCTSCLRWHEVSLFRKWRPWPKFSRGSKLLINTEEMYSDGRANSCCTCLLIPWRGMYLMLWLPVSQPYFIQILDFFFPLKPIISPSYGKFPRQPWLLLNPCCCENITLPLPPDFMGENSYEFEKPSLVGTEFRGAVSLPSNSDALVSIPNSTHIKDRLRFICQIVRSWNPDRPLKYHKM